MGAPMNQIQFGWHMPSYPLDGSSGSTFVNQIHEILRRIQPHFDSVWVDDHMFPGVPWLSNDTPYLECLTTAAYLATVHPSLKFGAGVLSQSYRNPALLSFVAERYEADEAPTAASSPGGAG